MWLSPMEISLTEFHVNVNYYHKAGASQIVGNSYP